MATVTYGPSIAQEAGLLLNLFDMIQNKRMTNAYKQAVTETLGGRKESIAEQAPYTMQMPSAFEPVGGMTEIGYYEGMQPTGFKPAQTTVPIDRQMTPDEQRMEDIKIRRNLEALGAGVPPSMRVDTSAMFPNIEEGMMQQKERTKAQYKAGSRIPRLVVDQDGKLYDATSDIGQLKTLSRQGKKFHYLNDNAALRMAQGIYDDDRFLDPERAEYYKTRIDEIFKQTEPTEKKKPETEKELKPDKFGFIVGQKRKLKNGKEVSYIGNDQWQ